jgi:hypothetical protein
MNAAQTIAVARKHLGKGSMVSSAQLNLQEAIAAFARGELPTAKDRALRSLQYSVGAFHEDYRAVAPTPWDEAITVSAAPILPTALDPIQAAAAKFSHAIAPGRSARYATVNSGDVFRAFEANGLSLRTVVAQKLRRASLDKGAQNGLQRHVFRFDSGITLPDGGRLEVLLRNSYDGTSSFGLSLGVFRIVCSNGLIAGTSFLKLSIPHTGSTVGVRVEESIRKVLTEGPRLTDTIERWGRNQLSEGRMMGFASTVARHIAPEGARLVNPGHLLSVRRSGDEKADLWTVFNRVQENVLAGGLQYQVDGEPVEKVHTMRRIRGAEALFRSNIALWDFANAVDAQVSA